MSLARPRTSDASMAATGGTAAAAAAIAEAEAEAVVVITTMTTKETERGRQQQSTIGHSWISTAFAICLDFNIDLTEDSQSESESDCVRTQKGGGCGLRQRSLFLYKTLFLATEENNK